MTQRSLLAEASRPALRGVKRKTDAERLGMRSDAERRNEYKVKILKKLFKNEIHLVGET